MRLERPLLFGLLITLFVAFLTATPVSAQIPNDPLLHYRSDSGVTESAGPVSAWKDLSGNGHDAVGLEATAPGYFPGGVNDLPTIAFSGGAFLRAPDVFPTASDYTKVVLVRISDLSATNNIFSGSNGHALWMQGTTTPRLFHSGSFVYGKREVAEGEAFLLVADFENASKRGRIRVNGTFAGAAYTTVVNIDSTIFLGAFNRGFNLTGQISEVLLFDRLLDDTELSDLETTLLSRYAIERDPVLDDPNYLTEYPRRMQLYARDADDSARVPIGGTVTDPGFDSVVVTITRDGAPWKELAERLAYRNDSATFLLEPTIYADTVDFGFRVRLTGVADDGRTLLEQPEVACGDVLMVTGQSNSIFANGGATWSSRWARSFGSNIAYFRGHPSDTLWGLSQGSAPSGPFAVGAWGLELQRLILESEGIPTAIINGGVGGSRIEWNLPTAVPDNLRAIYGRTSYRVRRSGTDQKVRALYWYQGESNTDTGYYENFRILYESWTNDYPALERIYVVQIRPGCALANRHVELRELLRTLPDSFANGPVPIIGYAPTTVPGHDGCHYNLAGYNAIARDLFRLTARDLYGADDTIDIASPSVQRAWYSNNGGRAITLEFAPTSTSMIWQGGLIVGDSLRLLTDAFLLDGEAGHVIYGTALDHRVSIVTENPVDAKILTYVPDDFYPGTNVLYQGPWLMNRRGVGAFTFSVPIEPFGTTGVNDATAADISLTALRQDARIAVTSTRSTGGTGIVVLLDATGRTIERQAMQLQPGENRVTFEVGTLARQELFVMLTVGDEMTWARVTQ